ncbi:MAG: hypothetical protein PXX82_01660 [Methanomassiliicoccales archaeon]|nr:hypothetical protein [Methanomassiliicoccales archaeon]
MTGRDVASSNSFVAGEVANAGNAGFPSYTGRLLRWSFILGIVPPVALIYALSVKSLVFLEYVHVITGATWTGFDLFMGLIMSMVFRTLEPRARVEVAKRLTPLNFFAVPSLATVAIVAGIYLAIRLGAFVLTSPWIIGAGIVVLVLTVQGFGIFLPNSVRIFIEVSKPVPDQERIIRLNMLNIKLAGVQAAFQVAIIFIMAHIAVLGVG